MSDEVKNTAPVEQAPEQQNQQQEQAKVNQPDPSAERFAQLARKEKALRAQARQLQEQQRSMQEQMSKSQSEWQSRVKSDPISVLAEAGLSHDDIANIILNSKPEDLELKRIKSELQALKSNQQEQFTKIQESQTAAYEQAVKQVSREVQNLVNSDEAYETIRATKSYDAVVELIKQTYNEDGVLLNAKEASDMVEEYLTDEAMSLAKLKKIQSKLAPQEPEKPVQQTSSNQKPQITTKTLTNSVTTSSKPMSAKDRRERAIAAFKGNLK
jgi:hypothetical protein